LNPIKHGYAFDETLMTFVDGELDDKTYDLVADHLHDCVICRRKIHSLLDLKSLLRNYFGGEKAGGWWEHEPGLPRRATNTVDAKAGSASA